MDDARAVLDAAGSEQAAVLAQGFGCPLAVIHAATYPERTRALILYNAVAKAGLKTDDYPWGSTAEELEAWLAHSGESWGSEEFARDWVRRLAPSAADDSRQIAWAGRVMRASATPAASRRFAEMNALMDLRALLPLVHVPTLVLVRPGRRIAVHIGARIAALAGPGEILVSSTVRDLMAGSELEFRERGTTPLKGVPGEWRLYAVDSGKVAPWIPSTHANF